MSQSEASTQAENPSEQIDASTLSPEAAQAFNPHAATPLAKQKELMGAWEKAQGEVGEVDYDAPLLPAKTVERLAAKPAKPAEEETEVEETPEEEVEAQPAEDEEIEEKPKAKAKASKPEKLTQAESRALIEQRVQLNQRFQRRDAQWQASVQSREAALQARFNELEPLQKAIKLFEAGDLNGFASTLGAITKDPSIKDWDGLNTAAINAVANPMYKRMRELERQSQERAEEMQRNYELQQAQAQEAARLREIEGWKASLADEANADEDPAVGNLLTSRPQMVDALFNIQQQHYHATGGDLLPARDAALQLLRNVREDYKFWSNYFEEHSDSDALAELLDDGDQAPKPVTKQPGRAARVLERQTAKKTSGAKAMGETPKPKPQVNPKAVRNISQAQTASASALKPLNEAQLKQLTIQRMEEEFRAQSG